VGTPRFGGTLHVAVDREQPHFDPHQTTTNHVLEVLNHVAEGLLTFGADGQPIPQLAESYTANEDHTQYTFVLREGVLFHNGKEMTSEDVVASLQRYLELSVYGRPEVSPYVESIEAPDDYTVVINLTQPWPFITWQLVGMIGGGPFIFPSELIAEVGSDRIMHPIGTGPYEFVEYRDNQFVRLRRFEDYVGREEPPNGFGGGRVAYLDEIVMYFVLDESVRIAGLQTGEYHVARNITQDLLGLYAPDPELRERIEHSVWVCFNFNKRQGPMTDQRIREAFRTAIDIRQLSVALGPDDFVTMDPALVFPGQVLHTTVGEDQYWDYDPDRARQLLEEAGYDGTPIRILVVPDSPFLYVPALIARPMLQEVGFNVQLVPVDNATYSDFRADPNRMDVFACAYSVRYDPTLMVMLGSGHAGWWDTPEKYALIERMRLSTNHEERFAAWEELQQNFYDFVPFMKIANMAYLNFEREEFSGTFYDIAQSYFVNTWLNE